MKLERRVAPEVLSAFIRVHRRLGFFFVLLLRQIRMQLAFERSEFNLERRAEPDVLSVFIRVHPWLRFFFVLLRQIRMQLLRFFARRRRAEPESLSVFIRVHRRLRSFFPLLPRESQ